MSRVPWVLLTAWLAAKELSKEDAAQILESCQLLCRFRMQPTWLGIVEELAASREVQLSRSDHEVGTTLKLAQDALGAIWKEDFSSGLTLYQKAAGEAAKAGRALDEWIYQEGVLYCLRRLRRDRLDVGEDDRANQPGDEESVKRRIGELRKGDVLGDWLDLAQQRSDAAHLHRSEAWEADWRWRNNGSRTTKFTRVPHDARLSFEDIRQRYGPPNLQCQFLKPTLGIGAFRADEEFDLRLRLMPHSSTVEWLFVELDETREGELAGNSICARFVDHTGAMDALMPGLLDTLPSLERFWTIEQATTILGWLTRIVASQCRYDARSLSKAIRSISRVLSCQAVTASLLQWSSHLSPRQLGDALNGLPWDRWEMTEEMVDQWLGYILSTWPAGSDDLGREDEAVAFALAQLVDAKSALLSEASKGRLAEVVERLLTVRVQPSSAELYVAVAFLAKSCMGSAWADVLKRIMDSLEAASSASNGDSLNLRNARLRIACQMMETTRSPSSVELDVLWSRVQANSEQLRQFYARNAFYARPFISFLATRLRFCDETARAPVASLLLAVLQDAPDELASCAPVFDRAYFGSSWDALVSLFEGTVQRPVMDAEYSLLLRLGQLDLVAHLARACRLSQTRLPESQVTTIVSALSDTRASVANHAAFAIVDASLLAMDEDSGRRIARALAAIVEDRRVHVRTAAHYGLPIVERHAHDEHIRQQATVLMARLGAPERAIETVLRARGVLESNVSSVPAP